MICAIDVAKLDRVVLIGHKPRRVVFGANRGDIAHLKRDSEGHYDRAELEALARDEQSNVVMYDEQAVMDIEAALPIYHRGCPPW